MVTLKRAHSDSQTHVRTSQGPEWPRTSMTAASMQSHADHEQQTTAMLTTSPVSICPAPTGSQNLSLGLTHTRAQTTLVSTHVVAQTQPQGHMQPQLQRSHTTTCQATPKPQKVTRTFCYTPTASSYTLVRWPQPLRDQLHGHRQHLTDTWVHETSGAQF